MKILVLAPRFPYPLDKGDKLRLYHQIVELSKQHEIYLFALSHRQMTDECRQALQPHCKEIHVEYLHAPATWWGVLRAFFQGQPLQVGYWITHRARKSFDAYRRRVQPDVVYRQMVRTMQYGEGGVLDFQDALSLNTRRRMERTQGPLRWVLNYEYHALQRVEQEALRTFDATSVIAPADRDALAPHVTLVPNGVDTEYFNALHSPLSTLHSVCFTGNMAYAPNVDAARYLVEEVMPLVWEHIPTANVLLAGADPKPAVKALASSRVTVSGRIPDIREAYASSQIFVAPMRIGSGLQNKLLEAMSMELPCITTSIAAIPLGSQPPVLVGDTPEALAAHIVQLLKNNDTNRQLARKGRLFVQEHYSWSAAVAPLEKLLLTH